MRFSLSFAVALATTFVPSTLARATQSDACVLGASDRAWLDRSVRGWLATRRDILEAPEPARLDAVVFDQQCTLRSSAAMRTGRPDWRAARILGDTVIVASQPMPVGVVSATVGADVATSFVMSTPSVWAKHHVSSAALGLEPLMSAVLIHEASHVFQMDTYGKQVEQVQKASRIADADFNDDTIQTRFGREAHFAASIAQETSLFFAAAHAGDLTQARRLARAARTMMTEREARYFVGDQAYQKRAEDLWLTMEGSAQWAGYRWLQLPAAKDGGGFDRQTAMAGFGKRGRSWTQLLGLAIALTVERIGPAGWKRHIFGDGRKTLLQLLDDGLTPPT